MIMSIFWPGNPVHDGAAVVNGNQVITVGSLLPLSDRTDLPSHWGTRHRAAAGLTERSDALVVLVSEERGRVLISRGKGIREIKTPEELKLSLQSHWNIKKDTEKGLRSEGFRRATVALFCFLLVASAWGGLNQGRDTLISLDVPVHYQNLRSGVEIVETSANSVRLQLSGFSTLINAVRPDQIAIKIDLGAAEPGMNTFQINAPNVALPPGIALTGLSPSRVDVILDTVATRSLPVQVDWSGKLPDGVILTAVQVEPSALLVKGRAQLLEEINTIYTEKIPLETILKSGTVETKAALVDAVRLGDGQKGTIVVRYEVRHRG
jgi:diadenylate cyclase